MNLPSSVYRRALGPRFETLPTAVQAFHSLQGTFRLKGEVTIFGATTVIGRLLAAFMRMPKPAGAHPFTFVLSASQAFETWSREFGSRSLTSTITTSSTMLTERIGLMKLWYGVDCAPDLLTMGAERATLLGCKLPLCLVPRIEASERGSKEQFHFDVTVRWPGEYRLVRYIGHLDLTSRSAM